MNLIIEDDEDRLYVKHGLRDFLAIDKAGKGISDKIINNTKRLIRGISTKCKIDYDILRVGKDTFRKTRGDCIGLMDCKEEGHWGAFYYIKDEDRFIVYDSSYDSYTIEMDNIFFDYLTQFSSNVNMVGHAHYSNHPMVIKSTMIRPYTFTRQPASYSFDSLDTSYASQHQFCFAEGLLFLEELLGLRAVSSCNNVKSSLIIIKRYMAELGKRLNYNEIPKEFFHVWDSNNKTILPL